MTNSVDPDQTAPIGAVCSGSTLFASILKISVILGNYLHHSTSTDVIFRCIFFSALKGLIHHQFKPFMRGMIYTSRYFYIMLCQRPWSMVSIMFLFNIIFTFLLWQIMQLLENNRCLLKMQDPLTILPGPKIA